MAVTANIEVFTSCRMTADHLGNYTGRSQVSHIRRLSAADVSKLYAAPRTTAVADSLDCTSLEDPFGTTIAFTTVKVIQIKNNSDTATLTVSGNLIGSDVITVGPGKCLYLDTERAVTGGSKILTMTPSAELDYGIILVGS